MACSVSRNRVARLTSYVICTSPRSGSTMLCGLLATTGHMGAPNSHFHTPSLASWLKTYDLRRSDFATEQQTLAAIFAAAKVLGTGGTDVFGLRLQRDSFDFFMQQTALLFPDATSDLARIEAAFGPTLFIHLTRPNKLEQAISRVKAAQTGLWHRAKDGSEMERSSPAKAPAYDAEAITHHMADLTALDHAWNAWFDREGIAPLRISYDTLSTDPPSVLRSILQEMGRNPDIADGVVAPTSKLADETSRAWAERFLAERQT